MIIDSTGLGLFRTVDDFASALDFSADVREIPSYRVLARWVPQVFETVCYQRGHLPADLTTGQESALLSHE